MTATNNMRPLSFARLLLFGSPSRVASSLSSDVANDDDCVAAVPNKQRQKGGDDESYNNNNNNDNSSNDEFRWRDVAADEANGKSILFSDSSYDVDDDDDDHYDDDDDNFVTKFDICLTIDDSMTGLHTYTNNVHHDDDGRAVNRHYCTSRVAAVQNDVGSSKSSYEYDWLLDGIVIAEFQKDDDQEKQQCCRGRRRKFDDPILDRSISMMEIECKSNSSSFSNSPKEEKTVVNNDGEDEEEEEEIEFFADFNSHLDYTTETADNDDEQKITIDTTATTSDIISIHHQEMKNVNDDNIVIATKCCLSPILIQHDDNDDECSSSAGGHYEPPESIAYLVSNIEAEIETAFVEISHLNNNNYYHPCNSNESSFNDNNVGDCSILMSTVGEDDIDEYLISTTYLQQPSLLMSSLLLESLPVPIPSSNMNDNPLSSFTRRMQKYHATTTSMNKSSTIQVEDELLERKLSDTIHGGYFGGSSSTVVMEQDCDYFDPIVLEEIMNVPFPFDVLNMDESFLNNDDDQDESDGSVDYLNFDTYISNRLTELDLGIDEIMCCMLARVSQKETAIQDGIEKVFATEMELSTALLYTKSSREYLLCAKNGYSLPSTQSEYQVGSHNVILGALHVVDYADIKDRLRYLLDNIDQLSLICDQEGQWWKAVNSRPIHPDRYQKLLVDARRLNDLVLSEELLNHLTGLATMKVRLNSLTDLLHVRIEDSIADLFARVLCYDETSPMPFDEFYCIFESLVNAWLSCLKMKTDNDNYTDQSQISDVEVAWSGCILKLLSFEASKAVALTIVNCRYEDEEVVNAIDDVNRCELNQMHDLVSQIKDEAGLESLSHRMLKSYLSQAQCQRKQISSIFFHLASRLVEVMNLYDVILQWLESLTDKIKTDHSESTDMEFDLSCSVSEFSSDNESSSISYDETMKQSQEDETLNHESLSVSIPENLIFRRHHVCSTVDQYVAIHKCMKENKLRRTIWKKCEASLINLISLCNSLVDMGVLSGLSRDDDTQYLRLIHDVLLQFTSYSTHFLGNDGREDSPELCSALETELSKMFTRHLRCVHMEAMKTIGKSLEHESWQLTPLELHVRDIRVQDSTTDIGLQTIYQTVEQLFWDSNADRIISEDCRLTTRAINHSHRYCGTFRDYLDGFTVTPDPCTAKQDASNRRGSSGIKSKEFISNVLQFVELKPCGVQSLSVLTDSSLSLLRWIASIVAVGNALPIVAKDASIAVMTLVDLYILTVFRFCAGNKSNEDVLLGFGRGTTLNSASLSTVSLSLEADAVAPLPRETKDFVSMQTFINCSRERLKRLVNLDKFQSVNNGSPSNNCRRDASYFARRLEKQTAAACSCIFVAMLVDVASFSFSRNQDQKQPLWTDLKDIIASIEKAEDISGLLTDEHSLETYTSSLVSVLPKLVTQALRYAAVTSLSGKELIFQIICCSRVWENDSMEEQSGSYIDELCERIAHLWGSMSSSSRLSSTMLKFTWDHLVQSAFLVLLEGFSKVGNCSTEGRSLMSMDLASLSHGLIPETVKAEADDDDQNIGLPPQACREEMMRYVDKFVKVFYYPKEEIQNWIEDNAGDYHFDHCLSLVTAKAAGSKDTAFMTEGHKAVAAIYELHKL